MIRFFKLTQPATLLIIPVIMLFFWARFIFHSDPIVDASDLPLWNLIYSLLIYFPSWLNFIILFSIVCAQVIYMNFMLNRHEVLYKNSFLPALIFVLFISSTPLLMKFHPVIVVNLLVVFILDRLFYLYKSNATFSRLFDSGMLAGISALIYFPGFILLPLMLATLWVMRPFKLKEWLIVIVAFLIPFFYLSVYYFWNHELYKFWSSYVNHFRNLSPGFDIANIVSLKVLAVFIGILLLLSAAKLFRNYRKNTIRTRSYQQVFFIYFLFGIAWLFLSNTIELIHFSFLIIPMVIFFTYYFLSAKNKIWIYEGILYLWIALIVWNHLAV